MPAAIARLQANDPAGAAEILEAVVKREPKNGRAWRNLGLANQLLKKFDRADEAYRQALAVEPEVLSPLYALGVVNAREETSRTRRFSGSKRPRRRTRST